VIEPTTKRKPLILALLAAALLLAGPALPQHEEHGEAEQAPPRPYLVQVGALPGVTWADDIHPIFVRNKCGHCHTRGKEIIMEGLEPYALGLIDPGDEDNAFYSYHELVYAEGPPVKMKGETLRDGQCCWPRGYPDRKQRRIWVGHAERSVIIRKLERDYYDWEHPPRFREQALRLHWGLPMPWAASAAEAVRKGNRELHVSFPRRVVLYSYLWLGKEHPEFVTLPPRIPERDRALLRYWINNSLQLEKDASIKVLVIDPEAGPAQGARVRLVGNFTNARRREVYDEMALVTDRRGEATLTLPAASVVSRFWFASASKGDRRTDFDYVAVTPGEEARLVIPFR
jgi:hypothetical protein